MRTIRQLTLLLLCAGLMAFTAKLEANPLDAWILEEIKVDERHLEWALRGHNGYDVEHLSSAKWYQPFFLEQPSSVEGVGAVHLAKLDDIFIQERETGLLEGGYLFRVRFDEHRALYHLSGGSWNDKWFDPSLGKQFEVEPSGVWAGSEGADFTYATILSGAPRASCCLIETAK